MSDPFQDVDSAGIEFAETTAKTMEIVISDTFLPAIEFLSACFSSFVIQITPHLQNRIVSNSA